MPWLPTAILAFALVSAALAGALGYLALLERGRNRRLTQALADAERTRAEAEASRTRMTDFAMASSDWFWEVDAIGRFTFISECHSRNLTAEPVDFVGKTRRDMVRRDEDAEDWAEYERAFDAREPIVDCRFRQQDRKGRTRTLSISGSPFHAPDGTFLGYRGVGRDISDRLKTEERIRQMHQELAKTLDIRTEGVAIFDADDRFVRCNAAYKWHVGQQGSFLEPGMSFESYVRQEPLQTDLIKSDRDMEAWVQWRVKLHRDAPSSFELQRPDGGWTLAREQRMDDGGWVITTTDITDLKDRETRLRDAVADAEIANRSKMEFLATMSHKLRTPLNAIIGFSEMIKSGATEIRPDRLQEYTGYIHESGTHLLSLINDILDVSRIEAGKYHVQDEVFELDPLLQEARRMIMHKAIESGLNVSVIPPTDVTHVMGDRRAIKQVVLNLLSNAIKFTPANGSISIEAEHLDTGALIIRVSDTGVGIPAKMLNIIFEAFRQIETVLARTHQGSGLGLYICKNLIEAHGGEIVIGPNPQTEGTLVTVTLPADRITRVDAAPRSVPRSVTATG